MLKEKDKEPDLDIATVEVKPSKGSEEEDKRFLP